MNTIGSYVFIDTSVFQEEGFFKPSGKVSKFLNSNRQCNSVEFIVS